MKKILIFKNVLGAFSETFIFQQAENYKKYNVAYLCSRIVKDGIKPQRNQIETISRKPLNFILECLLIYKLSGFFYLRKINKIGPDIIHCHFATDASLIVNYRKNINAKVVCTVHGYDVTTKDEFAKKSFLLQRKFLNYRERFKENVDYIIAVSEFIRNILIQQGYDKEKIIKHYIGVDVDKFKPSIVDNDKNKSIVFIGRFVDKKGIFDLLYVAKKFKEEFGSEFIFDIIGDGPLKPEVLRFIKENELDNVRLLGKRCQEEIIKALQKALVFFAPSKTAYNGDAEAFGIVFIEAQAIGVPVVSYAHGGIPEAVSHGQTGLLCEEGNKNDLYKNLKLICTDVDYRIFLSKNCRKYVLDNFSLEKQNRKLEKIYESILREHNES